MQRKKEPHANRQRLDLAGFAQEFLRRNPRYRSDYRALAHISPRTSSAAEQERMARRWGLCFPLST